MKMNEKRDSMTQRLLVHTHFFMVSGAAEDNVSELNAFDLALAKAGIAQCNLVMVSSILPKGSTEIEPIRITPGAITFTVLVKISGLKGDRISAGVGYGWGKKDNEKIYGIVAEDCGNYSKKEVEGKIMEKLNRMADARNFKLIEDEIKIFSETMRINDNYGCVVAALVYVL